VGSAADVVVFWIFAPVAVASAIAMLLMRNAVHSALLLVVNFFCLAVFFLSLGSQFLFVVQLIVYAGAIMVLFLFVIMLLGVDRSESLRERLVGQRWLAVVLGLGLIAEVVTVVRLGIGLHHGALPDFTRVNRGGNVQALANVLFGPYFFPFEVTSILLIVAAVGVMLHGRPSAVEGDGLESGAPAGEDPSADGGDPAGAPVTTGRTTL
jgi:NADH-quinone oxidoreductase subunit J